MRCLFVPELPQEPLEVIEERQAAAGFMTNEAFIAATAGHDVGGPCDQPQCGLFIDARAKGGPQVQPANVTSRNAAISASEKGAQWEQASDESEDVTAANPREMIRTVAALPHSSEQRALLDALRDAFPKEGQQHLHDKWLLQSPPSSHKGERTAKRKGRRMGW